MKLKLKRNVAGPWGGGYEGEVLHSPPVAPELAAELIRRGYAEELPEPTPDDPSANNEPPSRG